MADIEHEGVLQELEEIEQGEEDVGAMVRIVNGNLGTIGARFDGIDGQLRKIVELLAGPSSDAATGTITVTKD